MRITYFIVLLTLAVLPAAAFAQATSLNDRHCQFTVPAGWKVAPQQALDVVNDRMRQLQLGNVRYDMMLIPDPMVGDYPYSLVQFIAAPMEKATHKDLNKLVASLTGSKTLGEVNDKLAAANFSDYSIGEARLDLNAYRYTMKAELSLPDGKRVTTLVTGMIGTQGIVQFVTSGYPNQLNAVQPMHEQLVSSFAFDPGFAYTSATAAAAERAGGFSFAQTAVAGAVGGVVAVVVKMTKRRKAA